MTGHGDASACGREFWEFVVVPEQVEAVRAEFDRSVESGDVHYFSAELLSKSGSRRLIDWSSRPLVGLDERAKQLLCGVDVTERERHLREIRASRTRLVEAQDAERRRLERNLHDGAQQRLVSLSLALRLAQAKLAADPEGARDILAAAGDELSLALGELRELARGIHPAMLTDRGLGAAVESLVTRAPVPVELAAMPAERLPAPVEAAAFYVISEALANIGKYAQASFARVSVTRVDGRAVVEVADDGVGGADPMRGSGLRGLVDRVEALDGRLAVESPVGEGTTIVAEIPLTA
jgi:PAS domain S-box-containing protein